MPFSALSLYIHFPFCAGKCRYCDFYSVRYTEAAADAFLAAVAREWELVRDAYRLGGTRITTLYCGGGTPSILTSAQWRRFCAWVRGTLTLATDVEWSVECNPESFDDEKAHVWLDAGVNRLSLGVQTLDERLLRLLGRPHDARKTLAVLDNQILRRFGSIGADIIYGIPGQSVRSLAETINRLLGRGVLDHLSAYELSVHDATPFGRHRRLLGMADENIAADMMALVRDMAAAAGFAQYEVSNFARPGRRCRHNMAYWDLAPYIGLGPAAHSYIHPQRFANVSSLNDYVQAIGSGRRPLAFTEQCTPESIAAEMLFLRLRTIDGLDEERFAAACGMPFQTAGRRAVLQQFIDAGLLEYRRPLWMPTVRGLGMADAMARRLV